MWPWQNRLFNEGLSCYRRGQYYGFDICKYKIDFLQNHFSPHFPNFFFAHVDVHNTTYNPGGKLKASQFTFPYEDETFDLIYAASVFTHMLPDNLERYFNEATRVLRPGGRCVFSFFLLDYYVPGQVRPFTFNLPYFNLDHYSDKYDRDFSTAQPDNPEDMTAFRSSWLEGKGRYSGLIIAHPILPGLWSGSHDSWVGVQDIIIFDKR
ncbi:MAG TPA: class I SAM-dependent methyltransferase [Bryobacteraceae bacterium]|nr:class I SAM-dependent methyltransferase [Bryobacteraceae bacterium]